MGSAFVSQLQTPEFDSQLVPCMWGGVERFLLSVLLSVVGYLWIRWFPPTSKDTRVRLIGDPKLHVGLQWTGNLPALLAIVN